MSALVKAILILGAVFAVGYILQSLSDKLKNSTGRTLEDWIWAVVNSCILGAIGIGGIYLIGHAMSVDSTALVIVGMFLVALGLAGIYAVLIQGD